MKLIIYVIIIFSPILLSAQKGYLPTVPDTSSSGNDISVSDSPGAQELADLFFKSGGNLNKAVRKVIGKGKKAVDGLTQLVMNDNMKYSSKASKDGDKFPIDRVRAVQALESIACNSEKNNAAASLAQIAYYQTDPEIKGVALNALAGAYYRKVVKDKVTPDIQILAALVQNAGDTTYVCHVHKRITNIASEGFIRWLGFDFGDPQFQQDRMSVKKLNKLKDDDQDKITAEWCRLWWKDNQNKITWNNKKKHFETKK